MKRTIITALLFVSTTTLADVKCPTGSLTVITCRNSQAYNRQNLSTAMQAIGVCSAAQKTFAVVDGIDFRTGKQINITGNVEMSKNDGSFSEVPRKFEHVANLDTLSLAFTANRKSGLSVFSLGQRIQVSSMKCK